ncbi:MAG: 4-(cytidine 5'-diphospho)-2-C-methyl-D-erythritol kinase [SAR324 cluster bacterium]|nr:4-(cytidine 5'-diphospho)-2-C-methyl-D-erythritol kinase [SAR324 cluster bacterium]
MKIQTPAKINTQLYILKKRKDGYHELYMHMVPVTLFDTITIAPHVGNGFQLQMDGRDCGEQNENLIVKAAHAFAQSSGLEISLNFHLFKQIPVGAGLGGGSGNAAGVLQALNHYYNCPLSIEELANIAMGLGSDIPFFLNPTPSQAMGRGEQLIPLVPYPSFFLVIVKPAFSISTAQAYQNCQPASMDVANQKMTTINEVVGSLHNQFESTLFLEFPLLAEIKEKLVEYGAVGALVSGSGSAVFGVFVNEFSQIQASRQLEHDKLGEVFCCQTIDSYQYCS